MIVKKCACNEFLYLHYTWIIHEAIVYLSCAYLNKIMTGTALMTLPLIHFDQPTLCYNYITKVMYQYKNNNQLAFCIIIFISRIGQIILVIISAFVKKRKKGTCVIR